MLDPNLPLTLLDYEEFGNPRVQSQFESILSYSPYDNISQGSCHPSVLVTASFYDSRQILNSYLLHLQFHTCINLCMHIFCISFICVYDTLHPLAHIGSFFNLHLHLHLHTHAHLHINLDGWHLKVTTILRVGVWEAAKWVAKVRDSTCSSCSSGVILKTNMNGGHFGEGGRHGHCEETAYEYAFLMKVMGISCDTT